MKIDGVNRVLANALTDPAQALSRRVHVKPPPSQPDDARRDQVRVTSVAQEERPRPRKEIELAFDLSKHGLNIIGTLGQLRDTATQDFLSITAKVFKNSTDSGEQDKRAEANRVSRLYQQQTPVPRPRVNCLA